MFCGDASFDLVLMADHFIHYTPLFLTIGGVCGAFASVPMRLRMPTLFRRISYLETNNIPSLRWINPRCSLTEIVPHNKADRISRVNRPPEFICFLQTTSVFRRSVWFKPFSVRLSSWDDWIDAALLDGQQRAKEVGVR